MVSQKKRDLFAQLKKEAQSQTPLVKKINPIRAEYIPSLETVIVRNKRKKVSSTQEAYALIVGLSVVPNVGVTIKDIFPEGELPGLKEGAYVQGAHPFVIHGVVAKTKVSEVYAIPLDIKVVQSDQQNKVRDEYFEGTLQLRNADREVVDYTYELVRAEKNAEVSKVVGISDKNYDLFFTNKKPLRKIALALQRRFGGEVLNTSKIFTMDKDTQKDINRDTSLFRRYSVALGDIAVLQDRVYLILKLGKSILAKELHTQQNTVLEDDAGLHSVPWQEMQIISHNPLQVLDATTHETHTVSTVLEKISADAQTLLIAKVSEHNIIGKENKKT